ncbi:PilN domain-containing protein [Acerihabitans arboris]|uniref:Uncharacterized protein n=1 Tax=Acerihabitans arboris TaxID=2691583 RepID=A0A845SNF1_9GAMM|nr:PilN domain-containing protein [Acerihabitans arboris]NDL64476.1 hypothetical protein [Acerihabitans arboris]
MCQVNLLPWRRQRRRRRARVLMLVLAAELLLASGLMGLQALRWRKEQPGLGVRLAQWQQRETRAHELRLRLTQRIEWHQRLERTLRLQRQAKAHNQRYQRLFDELPGLLPPGLWLTALRQRDGRLSVSGCSERYDDIGTVNSQLSRHAWSAPGRWREISQREQGRFSFDWQTAWPGGVTDDAAR